MVIQKKIIIPLLLIPFVYFLFINFNNFFESKKSVVKAATIVSPAKNINQFSLISTDGDVFTNKELMGHWSLLFFGYTSCPDVCPHTLTSMRKVWDIMHAKLETKNYDKPNFFFVTLTPKEDTKDTLKGFLKSFHSDFKGLTGDTLEIGKIKKSMGVYTSKVDNSVNIEHTSSLFLVNPQGRIKAIFVQPFDEESVAEDLISIIHN
jgi:protein SCO1/2